MADNYNNGGGFVGGLASAVKGETKEIHTLPMAKWEDVGRIRAQTWNMAGLRMWQIAVLLFTLLAWAYTTYSYRKAEVVLQNDLTNIVNAGIIVLCILFFAVLVMDIRRDVIDSGAQWILIGVVTLFAVVFIFAFTPIATWAIINTISIGLASIKQIIITGWMPVLLSIVALSIVPDFQIGRFAWWRELTNQPAASSEKQVEDVTAIKLKQIELDHEREKWDRTSNTALELEEALAQISALQDEIRRFETQPPVKVFVPANHGRARASFGTVPLGADDQAALIKFINGWSTRGTSRDEWTGSDDQQVAGSHISKPQWEKITRALKNLNILDDKNQPLVSAEEAFRLLQMAQNDPPTPPKSAVGE